MKDICNDNTIESNILKIGSEGTLYIHSGNLVQTGFSDSECMSLSVRASLNLESTFKLIVETWLDQGISAKAIIDRVNSIIANKS